VGRREELRASNARAQAALASRLPRDARRHSEASAEEARCWPFANEAQLQFYLQQCSPKLKRPLTPADLDDLNDDQIIDLVQGVVEAPHYTREQPVPMVLREALKARANRDAEVERQKRKAAKRKAPAPAPIKVAQPSKAQSSKGL